MWAIWFTVGACTGAVLMRLSVQRCMFGTHRWAEWKFWRTVQVGSDWYTDYGLTCRKCGTVATRRVRGRDKTRT